MLIFDKNLGDALYESARSVHLRRRSLIIGKIASADEYPLG